MFINSKLYLFLSLSVIYGGSRSQLLNWRRLRGSNCVTISIGLVAPYEECVGCRIDLAMSCIDDMRKNVSGNVPGRCHMNGVTDKVSHTCCPKYLEINSKFSVRTDTSAYPDGLACMRAVGCRDSVLYTELFSECVNLCRPLFHRQMNQTAFQASAQSRCTGIFSAANSKYTHYGLVAFMSVVSLYYVWFY
mmetsp:Transcript_415/g.428  ORF Transcript_415/g.428 Transcript_415/m.428 type:complete len:191 (-) Transcript_415:43-615(-)